MEMNKKKYERILFIILLFGFLLRVLYIIAAPYGISKHDLGKCSLTGFSDEDRGHLGYISYLYHFKHLPDFDPRLKRGFYNPPGFHIISAVWYAINRWIGFSPQVCLENLQILTLIYVTAAILVMVKILQEIFPRDKFLLILAALLSFSPFFTILSGTLNNDALAFLCSMSAVLYTIRWYRKRTLKNIVIIAVSLGFGMFTKLNVGLLAFPIGFLFLYSFVKNRKEYGKFLLQFGVFGLICVPLGLYWPVRNYIRYRMPLNYIPRVNSDRQYVGDFSFIERIGLPSLQEISYPFLSFDAGKEYNIWVQMIRTSLFDEVLLPEEMSFFTICATVLFWLGLLGAVLAVVLWIRTLFHKNSVQKEMKCFFTILFISMLAGFVPFCFLYPHICTMNFRYIIPLLLLPCMAWESCFHAEKKYKILKPVLAAGLLLFLLLSLIMQVALILAA